jgi:hypothetical protein
METLKINKTKMENNEIKITVDAFGFNKTLNITPGSFLKMKLSYSNSDKESFIIVMDEILKLETKKSTLKNKTFQKINPLTGEIVDTGTMDHFVREGYTNDGIYRCTKHGHVTYKNFVWKEVTK